MRITKGIRIDPACRAADIDWQDALDRGTVLVPLSRVMPGAVEGVYAEIPAPDLLALRDDFERSHYAVCEQCRGYVRRQLDELKGLIAASKRSQEDT